MNFMNSNKKNTTVKFTNQNGKKSERVESHCAKPTMSFYQKLAKSEISTLIGTKKPRFNIEWESKFRSDRFRGLEKHTVMVDGKSRMRTGYFVPRKNLPSLFNAFPTQSLSTMPAFETLASSVQMWSGTKRSLIFKLSTSRPAPNITNSNLKSRAKQTETSSKTKNSNMGLLT